MTLHGLLAAGLAAYVRGAPEPVVSVALDLSSVELSFATADDEAAPVAPTMPSDTMPNPAEPENGTPRPELEMPKLAATRPELEMPKDVLPPDPGSVDLPAFAPAPERAPMETASVSPVTPSAAPVQARVDAPPKPKRTIRPEYPKGARQRGEQGDVVVEIRVNERGTVDEATVVSSCGFSELEEAAVRAVRSARFTPARVGRDPVASSARLTIEFKLTS